MNLSLLQEAQGGEDLTLVKQQRSPDAYFHHKLKEGLTTPVELRIFTCAMSQKQYHHLNSKALGG